MNIEQELLINKFGQSLVEKEDIINSFNLLPEDGQLSYLLSLINLILQSKLEDGDINRAIEESKLRETYTSCVLLLKGVSYNNLSKIANLPKNERKKVLVLFLHLFRIAYVRRFEKERNNPNKWWYWDLSDKDNMQKIRNMDNKDNALDYK